MRNLSKIRSGTVVSGFWQISSVCRCAAWKNVKLGWNLPLKCNIDFLRGARQAKMRNLSKIRSGTVVSGFWQISSVCRCAAWKNVKLGWNLPLKCNIDFLRGARQAKMRNLSKIRSGTVVSGFWQISSVCRCAAWKNVKLGWNLPLKCNIDFLRGARQAKMRNLSKIRSGTVVSGFWQISSVCRCAAWKNVKLGWNLPLKCNIDFLRGARQAKMRNLSKIRSGTVVSGFWQISSVCRCAAWKNVKLGWNLPLKCNIDFLRGARQAKMRNLSKIRSGTVVSGFWQISSVCRCAAWKNVKLGWNLPLKCNIDFLRGARQAKMRNLSKIRSGTVVSGFWQISSVCRCAAWKNVKLGWNLPLKCNIDFLRGARQAKMRNLSKIRSGTVVSGFWQISSVCRCAAWKNVKLGWNLPLKCNIDFLRGARQAKMRNLSKIRSGTVVSGFWQISSVCRCAAWKNVKLGWNLPLKCNIDFLRGARQAKMRNLSKIRSGTVVSGFWQISSVCRCAAWKNVKLGWNLPLKCNIDFLRGARQAKMRNLSKIRSGTVVSGFWQISSVCRCAAWKNVKLGWNLPLKCNIDFLRGARQAKMRNLSKIRSGTVVSGFWQISSVCRCAAWKNVKLGWNLPLKCNIDFLRGARQAKMRNLSKIRSGTVVSGFWQISSVYRCAAWKNVKLGWNLPLKCNIDFLRGARQAKMRNLSKIRSGTVVSGFWQISSVYRCAAWKNVKLGWNLPLKCNIDFLRGARQAKMRNLSKIRSGTVVSGFWQISSVYRCAAWKNVKLGWNLPLKCNIDFLRGARQAKMRNLSKIRSGTVVSGFWQISSVYRCAAWKNVKLGWNLPLKCNIDFLRGARQAKMRNLSKIRSGTVVSGFWQISSVYRCAAWKNVKLGWNLPLKCNIDFLRGARQAKMRNLSKIRSGTVVSGFWQISSVYRCAAWKNVKLGWNLPLKCNIDFLRGARQAKMRNLSKIRSGTVVSGFWQISSVYRCAAWKNVKLGWNLPLKCNIDFLRGARQAKMRNLSKIRSGTVVSGFWQISSVYRCAAWKNVKLGWNLPLKCNIDFLRGARQAKMRNLSKIRSGTVVSGFWQISSVCRCAAWKNVKLGWNLPLKCNIDFLRGARQAKMRNLSKIRSGTVVSGFWQISSVCRCAAWKNVKLGWNLPLKCNIDFLRGARQAKMRNLSKIRSGTVVSGFWQISSVCRCAAWKNVKLGWNLPLKCNIDFLRGARQAKMRNLSKIRSGTVVSGFWQISSVCRCAAWKNVKLGWNFACRAPLKKSILHLRGKFQPNFTFFHAAHP